jgi:microcystin-dependent protein
MVSTFTSNVQLEEPARMDYVGTWDLPINSNTTNLDLMLGGIASIVIGSTTVTLTSSQYLCKTIAFSGTLTNNTQVIFPSSISKSYEIYNLTNNPGVYQIVLKSTGTGRTLCAPPFDVTDVFYNATWSSSNYSGFHLKNRLVGSLWDHGGSSVPAWVSLSSPMPYLNCDGSNFSPTLYPMLNSFLGGTTLPDLRGNVKATLNQGTGRLVNVINGNTNLAIGGTDTVTLTAAQLASHTHANTLSDPGHTHPLTAVFSTPVSAQTGGGGFSGAVSAGNTGTGYTSMSINNAAAGSGAFHSNLQPTTVCGITLIRAG